MLGAISGDIIGSAYEVSGIKTKAFPLFDPRCRFTDDTVLTAAIAASLMDDLPLAPTLQHYAKCYPEAGFGQAFRNWIWMDTPKPYNSWGNGSAMRVSPVGFAFSTLEETLDFVISDVLDRFYEWVGVV